MDGAVLRVRFTDPILSVSVRSTLIDNQIVVIRHLKVLPHTEYNTDTINAFGVIAEGV